MYIQNRESYKDDIKEAVEKLEKSVPKINRLFDSENFTYDHKYNEKINEFIRTILVEEFEFRHHEEEILLEDNKRFVDNGGNFWIAFDDEENIIGTICLEKKENNIGELKKLYVHNDYRGKGVSHILYDELIRFARKNEILQIELSTYKILEAAIKFYIKKGFKRIQKELEQENEIYFILDEV